MTGGQDSRDGRTPAQEALRDYELRYRAMEDHVSLGMFRIDPGPGGRLLSANRVLPRLLGYDRPEDIIGKTSADLMIVPEDFAEIASEIRKDGSVSGREIRLRRRDGAESWVAIQAWKVRMPGQPEEIIEGFIEDVTEHRVFEQEMHYHTAELNRYAHALADANKKLNLLSSITRHDILNKLTGLQGYLELMKADFPDPRLQRYLAIQEEIVRTITLQIRFTRDYQEIGVAAPRWFDAGETVRAAVASLPAPPVPIAVEIRDLWIYADPLLEKVFANLVENALWHAEGLTRIAFFQETSKDTGEVLLVCEDDGCGVPEEFKEAIFLRKHFRNTGFGLFLSREILGITGLGIRETGRPGSGARFEIAIPPGYYRSGGPGTHNP